MKVAEIYPRKDPYYGHEDFVTLFEDSMYYMVVRI